MVEYTYLIVNLPAGTTREVARQIMTEHAEYGGWELHVVRVHRDGRRRIQLRKKIIRQRSTLRSHT
ncbi:DUF5703 family protein [Actinocorallia libanotica]|uniref:DUF5703 family protein n=1 Tax=Actinocorallia libanotica TaxID=46162 RepID=A0ABP4CC72_9ACTN